MTNLARFRPISGSFFGGVVFLIAAIFIIEAALGDDLKVFLESLFIGLGVSALSWAIFIRPSVLVFDEGLKVVNPLISIDLPWQILEQVDTRWALTIYFAGKKVSAWAATAPGRYQSRTLHASDLKGVSLDRTANGILASDNPHADSGSAANAVRTRWQVAVNEQIEESSLGRPEVKINVLGIATVTLSALAAAATQLLIH